jgi:hypothetical protein
VQVVHGVVSVQHGSREVFLTAGQSLATAVAENEASPAADSDAGEPAADEARLDNEVDQVDEGLPRAPAEGKPARSGLRRQFDSRELADQNQRFARAMTHKKNAEPRAALRELTGILRRYPGSPLTQEVRVERLRILRGLGASSQAAREAKRYLHDFPEGYAVKEAQELLSGAP